MSSAAPESLEHLFAGLNRRQTMLLLTSVTFGTNDPLKVFDHLPEKEAEVFRHRGNELMQIPGDRRIPLVVQEIKRLVTARKTTLWAADPVALATMLRKERPALVEMILRALPASLADAVRDHLPPRKVKLTKELKPEVLDIIRWKMEEMLAQ